MARAEKSVVIERPVEEVWAYLNDCSHDPEWMSMITETEKLTDGPVGVGTIQRSAAKLLGRRIDTTFEITEHEPNRFSRCAGGFVEPIAAKQDLSEHKMRKRLIRREPDRLLHFMRGFGERLRRRFRPVSMQQAKR